MIGDIRGALKTRKVKILVWVMLGSLFISFIPMALKLTGKFRSDSLGTVNGQHIGALEFKRKVLEVQNMMKEIRQNYGLQADMVLKMWGFDKQPEELVLEGLVGEKIMKAVSESLGTRVHNDYLQSKLKDQFFVRQYLGGVIPPQALRGGTLDVAALKYNLERQGISAEDFEEMLNDALLRAFLLKLVEGGLYIPDDALQDAYIGQYLKKKYAYLTLPRSGYLSKAREKKVTENELEEFYTNPVNQETYRIPEKRSAKIWAFTPDGFGIELSDKDVEMAYHRRKRNYIKTPAKVDVQHILFEFTDANKLEVRAQAQEVLKQAQADPEKFAELAAKHSQAKDKAETISLKRTDKNRTFTNAAFDLQKGGISPVIETVDGFEMIKLIDKKRPEYKPLELIKAELTKKLKTEKFGNLFGANAQRVVSQSREEPTFLKKFIERRKGQESSVKDTTRSEKKRSSKIFSMRRIGDKAFYEDGGKGYIVELTAITPSVIPPLASVKGKVEDTLYTDRALEMMKKDLKQGLQDVRSGTKTLSQVAQALNGTVEITDWVSFTDQGSLKKLQQMKIKLPELVRLTKQGAITSDITDKDGYLIQVKQIDPFKAEEFEDKKPVIRYQLSRQEVQALAAAFVQALRDTAEISLNPEILRRR